ncbi:MAG TPA: hypothetical protein ACFCUD_06635 [Cyclobacteriaceae bacterium]
MTKPGYSIILALSAMFIFSSCNSQPSIPNREDQIMAAVMAAPEEFQNEATVMGYDSNGALKVIRNGKNEIICLADDPSKEGFSCACYHKDLDPYMARRRALRNEGKGGQEMFEIVEQEVQDGKLNMPDNPTTLHVLYGKNAAYDSDKKVVENAKYRYVVYIPYATPESTGLLTKPRQPGDPWIMDPGTHRAHIMITPVVED